MKELNLVPQKFPKSSQKVPQKFPTQFDPQETEASSTPAFLLFGSFQEFVGVGFCLFVRWFRLCYSKNFFHILVVLDFC